MPVRSRTPPASRSVPCFARRAFAVSVGVPSLQEGPASTSEPDRRPTAATTAEPPVTETRDRRAPTRVPEFLHSCRSLLGPAPTSPPLASQIPRLRSVPSSSTGPWRHAPAAAQPAQRGEQHEETSLALPALRRGAPARLAWSAAAAADLTTEIARKSAFDQLLADFYAPSSGPSVKARRKCYARLLALWGHLPWPLEAAKVLHLAAGLKARRYRSAASILSQYRVDAERQGQDLPPSVHRVFTDCARSCRRGLGPTVQARALDFERLAELPAELPEVTAGHPSL